MQKDKWKSFQSIILMLLILVIFGYMAVDIFQINPKVDNDINNIKTEYKELSIFLSTKIPEIDSTLKFQTEQIISQGEDISDLNIKLNALTPEIEE